MTTTAYLPVLYEIDADGEATGTIHFYCSAACRETFDGEMLNDAVRVIAGNDCDAIDQTVCEGCGIPVTP